MAIYEPMLLQSGFVSFPAKDTINELIYSKPTTVSDVMNNVLKGNSTINPPSKFLFSPTVEQLYKEFHSDSNAITNFEYRKKILTIAKYGLSKHNTQFHAWLAAQNSFNTLTSMHKEFLIDTLKYLLTGTRKISVESWYRVLTPRAVNANDKLPEFNVGDYVDLSIDRDQYHKLPRDIGNILGIWTSHEHGFVDLLYTLIIIFGEYK